MIFAWHLTEGINLDVPIQSSDFNNEIDASAAVYKYFMCATNR
jgi:hypothetical protein